jgi:hypothetical protein
MFKYAWHSSALGPGLLEKLHSNAKCCARTFAFQRTQHFIANYILQATFTGYYMLTIRIFYC